MTVREINEPLTFHICTPGNAAATDSKSLLTATVMGERRPSRYPFRPKDDIRFVEGFEEDNLVRAVITALGKEDSHASTRESMHGGTVGGSNCSLDTVNVSEAS